MHVFERFEYKLTNWVALKVKPCSNTARLSKYVAKSTFGAQSVGQCRERSFSPQGVFSAFVTRKDPKFPKFICKFIAYQRGKKNNLLSESSSIDLPASLRTISALHFPPNSESSQSVHVECRIGGADLNPYLAFAALIAAGIAGIDEGLELPEPAANNIYTSLSLPELPKNLKSSVEFMANSTMLKTALGENVVQHYANSARIELEEFEKQVTDWELSRGFDRC
uniref:Gln-synt_C domain-containing protein n=1 Tax=Globodera pallida TaxID=36090 RepID=A0A183CGM1_GLOPA